MSTPNFAKLKGFPVTAFEFGKVIESELFTKQVDWLESDINVIQPYVESVINAVLSNTILPKKNGLIGAKSRFAGSATMGVDLYYPDELL